MNYPLKRQLLTRDMRQRELARYLNRSDKWVSMVANEEIIPDDATCKAIARVLRCTVASLWPDVQGKA